MSELLAWIFASTTLIAGAYIWMLKHDNDELRGGIRRLNRELNELRLKIQREKARNKHD